ncbi:porin family protein [Bacteroides pyogenes]|uniref:porin family protein n=1 Tax=Bacteroides pyogenes TaxID=310300 RepID=UPI001BA8AC1E|nr:porin family protein [Bacteroides pyogenes]
MKKNLLTMLLASAFCMAGKAQDFKAGVIGGYNLSTPSAYDSQSGFHVGLKGELGLPRAAKGLYVDFGLLLSSQGWKTPGYYYNGSTHSAGTTPGTPSSSYASDWECTPYYLGIPVHVGYKFPAGRNVSLFVNAGPYFNIGLFGKARETIIPENGKATIYTRADNVFSDKMQERFDWGLGFRAGVEVVRHIQVGIGYDWGMKNVNKNGVDNKNRTFVASCTYMF